jgi:hypothetical protein
VTSIVWKARSGVELEFKWFNPEQTNWFEVGGLYIFAKPNGSNWIVHYVGQTGNFRERFSRHEHWPSAMRLGCDCILAACVPDARLRNKLEAELIAQYSPALNTQLKPVQQPTSLRGAFPARPMGNSLFNPR